MGAAGWATSTAVDTWKQQVLPAHLSTQLGSEQQAAILADNLAKHGFLASLDYKLAFAHVNPEVVTQAMAHAHVGMPLALTQTINFHWKHQTRWLQYRTSTAQEPLCTSFAIPHIDPLSLLLAGANYVEAAAPALHPREQVIYMDDRSWTSTSVDTLAQTMSAWHTFSSVCGLKESTDKTQTTYFTQQHFDLLQQHPYFANMPQAITSTACVLGACASGSESALLQH